MKLDVNDVAIAWENDHVVIKSMPKNYEMRDLALMPFKPEEVKQFLYRNHGGGILKIDALPLLVEPKHFYNAVLMVSCLPELANEMLFYAKESRYPDQVLIGIISGTRLFMGFYDINAHHRRLAADDLK